MFWILLGAACSDKEVQEIEPCTQETWYADSDGDGFGNPFISTLSCTQEDGFVDNDQDCDDENAQAYPDAMWYRDADTDGFGDPDAPLRTCVPPQGYVTNADDCDDFDASKNPDRSWYGDADGDGYGGTEEVPSCDPTDESVSNNLDCNDDDFFIHPDGIEICDGIDNNCNGDVDDEDALLDTFTTIPHFVDDDEDGYGSDALLGYFCPSYSTGSLVSGDCDDTDSSIHPRAIDKNDDIDTDCDGTVGTMNAHRFTEGWNSPFGGGFGLKTDFAPIGSDPTKPAMIFAMHSYDEYKGGLFYLPPDLDFQDFPDITEQGVFWSGHTEQERVGRSLAFVGDMNGDGIEDIMTGGGFEQNTKAGSLYFFSIDRPDGDIPLESLHTSIDNYQFANDILAIGDVNEDGFDDALVTARADDSAGTNRGAVHVFSGGETPTLTHSIYGATNGQYIGWQLATINDFDGDGIIEYAISSIYSDDVASDTGSVLLLPKSMLFDETLDVSTLQKFHGIQSKEHVGFSIVDAGDFNGDGQTDLLIGAPDYNINDADEGRAFLVYGGETESDLSLASHIFYGAYDDDNTGEYVHRIGDVNGDGLSDIAIVAHKNDDKANNAGAVYGVYGGAETGSMTLIDDASFILYGATSNDQLGRGLNPVGDVDGDGYDDFWLTSTSHGYGKAYLMYGSE